MRRSILYSAEADAPTGGVLDRVFGLPEVPVVLDLEAESVRVSEEFKEPA
jgi:hypothetical protein